jgi:hypothetical protein
MVERAQMRGDSAQNHLLPHIAARAQKHQQIAGECFGTGNRRLDAGNLFGGGRQRQVFVMGLRASSG